MGKLSFGWLGVAVYILCLPVTHVFAYNEYINLSTISVGILIVTNWNKISFPKGIEYICLFLLILISSLPFLLNRPDYEKSAVHYFAFLGSAIFFFIAPTAVLSKYSLKSIECVVKCAIYGSVILALIELIGMIFFQYQMNLPRPDVNYYDPPLFMIGDYRVIRVRGWSVESGHFATSILFLSLPFLFGTKNCSKKINIFVFINIMITNGMTAFGIYCINLFSVFFVSFRKLRISYKILSVVLLIYPSYFALEKIIGKAFDSSAGDRINRIMLAFSYVESDIGSLLLGVGPGMLNDIGVKGSVVSFFGVLFFEYGAIVFLLFILFLIILLIKNNNMEGRFFITAFLLNAVFISNFWYPFFWYPLILLNLYKVRN